MSSAAADNKDERSNAEDSGENLSNNDTLLMTSSPRDDSDVKGSVWRFCQGRLPPWRALVTLTACVLVEATLGVTYTTGNLMPYLTSYLRNVTQETSLDYSQTLWVNNSLFLVLAIFTAVFGLLEQRMPRRPYFLLGLVFNATSFFGSYWAVQDSFIVTVVMFGVVQGLAQAVLYPLCLNLALEWFPHRKGVVAGFAMAGYGGGAFMWNQIVTQWINPDNLQPDIAVGDDLYFTQASILHRVPSCFLVLGGVLTTVQLLCLLAFTYPPPPPTPSKKSLRPEGEDEGWEETEQTRCVPSRGKGGGEDSSSTSSGGGRGLVAVPSENGVSRRSYPQGETPIMHVSDYTPLQILTSRTTWTLWLTNFSTDLTFFFIPAFYKTYGQTFIPNDHLLSLIASFASVFNAVCRPLWGLVADRIGCLPCLLVSQGLLTVMSATIVLCETADSAAMFFVWVCGIYACFCGYYVTQPTIIYTVFGARNFVFALGIAGSTAIVSTFVSVPLATAVLDAFGWKGIFFVAAAGSLISMLIPSSLLISCGRPLSPNIRAGLLAPRRYARNRRPSATDTRQSLNA